MSARRSADSYSDRFSLNHLYPAAQRRLLDDNVADVSRFMYIGGRFGQDGYPETDLRQIDRSRHIVRFIGDGEGESIPSQCIFKEFAHTAVVVLHNQWVCWLQYVAL